MAKIEMAALEHTISQAFHGEERVERELRLSAAECACLRRAYPCAQLTPLPGGDGEKSWYQVRLYAAC